jgi:hypothetical protein
MIYARVHNRTVAEDYYGAMDVVEKRLEVVPLDRENTADPLVNDDERAHLLELATQLAEPGLGVELRLDLVDQLRRVLNHGASPDGKGQKKTREGHRCSPLPPSLG